MRIIFKILTILTLTSSCLLANKEYYISINETPKYKKDFKHFDYVNPKALKGGSLKMAVEGTYDSFNPFTLKGQAAEGVGLLYDTLMVGSLDENSVYYPLIAEAVEVGKNRDFVRFFINKNARFHDKKEVTAEDVKFSFDTLTSKGSPIYKRYYQDVKEAIVEDKYTIRFDFKRNDNKELPLILSQIAILPKHFWQDKDFLDADFVLPIGSGAYKIEKYEFGKYITLKRDNEYWAKDLNVNVGQYNFDEISYDYYKDKSVILEAFKAGLVDFVLENTAKNWATQYEGKNFENHKIIKREIPHENAQGMQGFVFNLRNPLFQDLETRKALNLAFDFEWTNKKLFYEQYKRSSSYFDNCELKATGKPSIEELKLLENFKHILPKEVFADAYKPNTTKGDGNIRNELKLALKILKKQGWDFNEKKILQKDGKEFRFEILLNSNAFERVLNPFIQNLKKLGIIATIRIVDQVSYMNKINNFNYDMIVEVFGVSLSPGNELRSYWGSKSAYTKGSRNYAGIKSEALDFLINCIVLAKNRKELVTATRALDRVLTHSYLVISNWHMASYRVAYWNKFDMPKITPKYGFTLFSWWQK